MKEAKSQERVMSGMRTTASLHLGNYFGALKNWVKLQDQYPCYFGAMNWHAMTDHFKDPSIFQKFNRDIISDWIAFGIDPRRSVIFIQSELPELLELNMLFTAITPMGWLDRVTTWKDAEEELKAKDAHNLGRFAYPVLQAADIAIFKGTKVPVGQDQVPHLELAREIVRRFNFLYKSALPEPQHIFTDTPVVMGTDGRKMSKSYGNYFPLIAETQEVEKLLKPMPTDPARVRRSDPGNPEVCPVFAFHKLLSPEADREWAAQGCRTAGIGCMDCKMNLAKHINHFMEKPREKKKELLNNPSQLDEIIDDGCKRARLEAKRTLGEVKDALGWES